MTRIGPLPGVEWHMIGHVQSRKARLVAENFALVHSLDSIRLARRLDAVAVEHGKCLPVLLEVNLAGEESKTGWCAADESRWGALLADFSGVAACSNLKVCGLMAMPPLSDDPEQARPYFKKGRRLQTFLKSQLPQVDWSQLSMGTSADYEAAVQEGATFVRIGTAILGKRSKMPEIG
jgi:PLP dependent protein